MLRKARAPRDEGLQQIAEWQAWFLGAQLDVISTRELTPDQRKQEIAEAERLSAAIGDQMRYEYQINQRRE